MSKWRTFDITTPDGQTERVYLADQCFLLTEEEIADVDMPIRYALYGDSDCPDLYCTCRFEVWLPDSKNRETYSWQFGEQCGYTITEVFE